MATVLLVAGVHAQAAPALAHSAEAGSRPAPATDVRASRGELGEPRTVVVRWTAPVDADVVPVKEYEIRIKRVKDDRVTSSGLIRVGWRQDSVELLLRRGTKYAFVVVPRTADGYSRRSTLSNAVRSQ
ncbi:MAG: hypothetical protein F2667_10040 [Actinobacteria bacterium]|nr:hypothetical protein [Actinomycetota bacterium]